MPKITKLEAVGSFFIGKGDIIIADALTLASQGLSDIANPISLGDIKEGSTKWTGNAPKFTEYKNEKGEVVVSAPVNGDYGVEFTVMSFSQAMQAKLLAASTVATTFAANGITPTGSTVTGFGSAMPVLNCPLMVVNTDLNKIIVFPNAQIISQMVEDSGATVIKVIAKAQKVDTTKLKTVMQIEGAANYTTA